MHQIPAGRSAGDDRIHPLTRFSDSAACQLATDDGTRKRTARLHGCGCWAAPAQIGALPRFLIIVLVLAVLALLVGFVVALVRYGPLKAGDSRIASSPTASSELCRTSPRRVWALARLAIKESFRRRVVVALVVFFLILLFAGWFLKTDYPQPAKLFFSFVLTATTYLVLLIALF